MSSKTYLTLPVAPNEYSPAEESTFRKTVQDNLQDIANEFLDSGNHSRKDASLSLRRFQFVPTATQKPSVGEFFNLNVGGSVVVSSILDEDNMASDSDTALATQQSIKAYIDSSPSGPTSLNGLTDVTITSPSSGQILEYNGSLWVNSSTSPTGVTQVSAGNGISTSPSPITGTGTVSVKYSSGSNLIDGAGTGSIDGADYILFRDNDDSGIVKKDTVSQLPFAQVDAAETITGNWVFDADITWNDGDALRFGSSADYWLEYNATGTQFEFWTSDSNGSGSDALLMSVSDGGTVVDFNGQVITPAIRVGGGAQASVGEVRLSYTDVIAWRNATDSADVVALTVDDTDNLLNTSTTFRPDTDGLRDLGTTAIRWRHIYADDITVTDGFVSSVDEATNGGITVSPTSGAVLLGIRLTGTDNYILEAPDQQGVAIATSARVAYSDGSNNVQYGNVSDLPFPTKTGSETISGDWTITGQWSFSQDIRLNDGLSLQNESSSPTVPAGYQTLYSYNNGSTFELRTIVSDSPNPDLVRNIPLITGSAGNDQLLVSTGTDHEADWSGDLTFNASTGLDLGGTGLDISISGTGRFEGDGSGLTDVSADTSTVTDLTTQTATYYPIMADGTSGAVSHFVDASELSYTSSTDTLNVVSLAVSSDVTLGISGVLNFGGTSSSYLNHNNISSRDKIRVWNSSFYTIGMQNSFTFGPLGTSYAMTFQMNDDPSRGFWWGHNNHTQSGGAMALNTDGYLTLARHMRLGYGEGDTTTPTSARALDISMDSGATIAIDINGLVTGDYILDWGGTGYSRMTKITDQGGFSLGCDSSMVIFAGDRTTDYVTGAGIVAATSSEILHLGADASVLVSPGHQSAYTQDYEWTFTTVGSVRPAYNGAAATPTYAFNADTDTGMRLASTGILRLSAGTDDAYLDVDSTNNRILANRILLISEGRSELLRLDSSTTGGGDPYMTFYVDGDRHGYLQYVNLNEEFRFVQEESTGGFFSFYNGSPSTDTRRFVIDGLGDNVGRTFVENSQFYVKEDQTVLTVAATVTCDWDRSNQLHLTITNTVTTIAIDDNSMQPGGSYILMVQEGASAPSSVMWSSTDTIFWANGTAPVLNAGDLNDITVVQFFKTTAGSNTRIIGSWFLAQ